MNQELLASEFEALPLVMTTKEVAALLRVCTKTIYMMVERRLLPARSHHGLI